MLKNYWVNYYLMSPNIFCIFHILVPLLPYFSFKGSLHIYISFNSSRNFLPPPLHATVLCTITMKMVVFPFLYFLIAFCVFALLLITICFSKLLSIWLSLPLGFWLPEVRNYVLFCGYEISGKMGFSQTEYREIEWVCIQYLWLCEQLKIEFLLSV